MKTYKLKINGKEYTVDIESLGDDSASVKCNGTSYDVAFDSPTAPKKAAKVERKAAVPTPAQQITRKPSAMATENAIKAPIPGLITELLVAEGDTVESGQIVAKMEAMKMENNILASADCTITAIMVKVGDSVLEGDVLIDTEGA